MYELNMLIVLLVGTHTSEGSIVIDRDNQDGLHISDYCPESPHCVEGSHVMCMYYNPDKVMGPHCYDPQNVTMDVILANKLMKLLNALRAKIALGKERGMNDELLPRAYGMMKLSWDSELATFAQVLANQCLLMHDLCRATSRFHNPGQVIGSCRFTYPAWTPISKIQFHSSNLTQEKLLHAMTAIVKSWYSRKAYVTPTSVLEYPDWSKTSALPKIYLEMIYGPITHVGCGVSAATTYSYSTRSEVILNIVIVVCNLSSRPSHNKPVYTTVQPTQVGYTVKCGCPPGYDEDENCLCSESKTMLTLSHKQDRDCFLKKCRTNMILLPIFTVEDAPPDKLIPPSAFTNDLDSNEMFTSNNNNATFMEHLRQYPKNHRTQSVSNLRINGQHRIGYKQTTIKPIVNVQPRFFDRKSNNPKLRYQPSASRFKPVKKTSIFSKVPVFDLNNKKGDQGNYIHNVQPRKDFSSVKNLVEDYMNIRRNRLGTVRQLGYTPVSKHRNSQPKIKAETHLLKSAEEKVLNYNYHPNNNIFSNISDQTLSSGDFTDLESSNERADDNLMHLLNKLEQEVKHTEIDGVKREIFDAKIRKIYGAVVGDADLFKVKYSDSDSDFLANEATDIELVNHNKYIDHQNLNRNLRKHHEPPDYLDAEISFNNKYYDRNFEIHRNDRPIEKSRRDLMQNELDKEYVHELKNKYDSGHKYGINKRIGYSKDMLRKNEEINPKYGFTDKGEKLRDIYADLDGQEHQSNNIENRPIEHEKYNNAIDSDRRKYYQAKLENLERKLRESKKHRKAMSQNKDRPSLPVRPKTRVETPLRPLKTQLDPFYMADRARFLHGF